MVVLKPATTYSDQISLLESKGLIIQDKNKAMDIISWINYYTFTGYTLGFKRPDGYFVTGVTFEKIIYNIIEFDRRIRNVLAYILEVIERTVKTKLAYELAHCFGPDGYMNPGNFRDAKEHRISMDIANESVRRNRNLLFVKHHLSNYSGKLPIWVLVEILTFGNLYHLYKNMRPPNQKAVAAEFQTGVLQLKSWLKCICYTRNLAAHYMRLYNFKLRYTPAQCNVHHTYKSISGKIFDVIYVMMALYPDFEEWNNYILVNFTGLFEEYDEFVSFSDYGFPVRWEKYLTKTTVSAS